MRTFWIGVVVLLAVTAAVFLLPSRDEKQQAEVLDTAAQSIPVPLDPPVKTPPAVSLRTPIEPTEIAPQAEQPRQAETVPTPTPTPTNPPGPIHPDELPGEKPAPDPDPIPEQFDEPNPPTDMPSPDDSPATPRTAAPGTTTPGTTTPGTTAPGTTAPGTDAPGLPVSHDTPVIDLPDDPHPEIAVADSPISEHQEDTETSGAETPQAPVGEPVIDPQPEINTETQPESNPAPTAIDPPTPRSEPSLKPIPRPKPAPVVHTPNGLVLDGRWTVPGEGTKESPYKIGWDMLIAVKREYKPRLGRDKVPEWIEALDGKRVTIEGYTLLPIGIGTMNELLMMQNQWDGCCIGVPPTPFDAIEVQLKDRLNADTGQQIFGQGGALTYGQITGTFEIDPYIAQSWLLGLYLINDAHADLFGPAGSP